MGKISMMDLVKRKASLKFHKKQNFLFILLATEIVLVDEGSFLWGNRKLEVTAP